MQQQKVELIDGKFVVRGKEAIPKSTKEKPPPKQYSEEVIALRDRVVNGNQRLFEAWLKIKELAHDSEEWSRQMDRWNEAQEKLHVLCLELKMMGYSDCLYLDESNRKTKSCLENPDGFWCQVCPSGYPYWEVEAGKLWFKEESNGKPL